MSRKTSMLSEYNMVRKLKRYFILIGALFAFQQVFAQHDSPVNPKKEDDESVSTILNINNKDGIFNSVASFTFDVKNTYDTQQEGTVSYLITDEKGVKIKTLSKPVKIERKSTEHYSFEIPALKTGFYKLNMMINVSDYDDTTRRAFGIRADEVKSAFPKPADFDSFWANAKAELAKVKPQFKVTEDVSQNTDNRRVFLIEMKSLDNLTIRGWMTIPKNNNKNKQFSVLLGLPGYQVTLKPIVGRDDDLAIITLNTRGQGNSRDVIHTERDAFISYNIEDRDKYVMRGVIMDCVRAVDFIYSRKELRHDQILATGGSMGGYLAIALAALDKRVTICSAQNPILSDVHNLVGTVEWPIKDIRKYVAGKPGVTFDQVLHNMEYYDTKNFATDIKCPILLGLGLLDPYVPPGNGFAVYNSLNTDKKVMVFKDLGHEVSQKYKDYEGAWMRDTFGLF
ncbi:acetylxylan esterase [Mucilaginibacter ginsenosidivorax]|uniref:Prolyl oligopeptidase family serine peptidase n=1 Tax=Mucilaginibacter ginsenosidivorax TaxID=862126 RepID=A0A5B8VWY4_9SPHI|nr:acetylxylan esterase [Mucilaginibacter ginsenosidivorax]QEC75813.1 prolyl oligopeptidase family serine peptidase [Mucilaginibacter ginsenosidivorax]